MTPAKAGSALKKLSTHLQHIGTEGADTPKMIQKVRDQLQVKWVNCKRIQTRPVDCSRWMCWMILHIGGLVHSLGMLISLKMKPRGETNLGSKRRTELLPHAGSELRTLIRNDIHGDPMKPKHVVCGELGCLDGRRKL